MSKSKLVTAAEFETALQTRLSDRARLQWQGACLEYEELTQSERDRYILDVVEALLGDLHAAGEHRLAAWESGWRQNLEALKATRSMEGLVPRYHSKHNLVRWNRKIIRPLQPDFDYHIHRLLVDWAMETYLAKVDAIYEFGCGPAYHLLRARKIFPKTRMIGLDWTSASQEIIAEIVAAGIDNNMEGRNFNFYQPDAALNLYPNSGVMTVAALEQVGDRFKPFLEFLLQKRPAICVHLEPIDELMDPTDLLDRLSVLYSRKRNYLNGFLTCLRALEKENRVTIHQAQRTFSGSYFLEGHSLIVWSPR